MFERSAISSMHQQIGVNPNLTNLDITSLHNLTRVSNMPGPGMSHINFDEKTELFEEQFEEEEDENDRFVVG
jgi:hypothetical protein